LLAGFHSVISRMRQSPQSVDAIYVDEQRQDRRMLDLLASAKQHDLPVHSVTTERLDQLAGTVRHQGVLAFVKPLSVAADLTEVFDFMKGPALLLVLDNVTDPHNLGACLRTANAAGVHAVIAPKDRSAGLNAVAERVACGAAQTTPFIMVTNLARTLRELKERGVWIIGTDERADQYATAVDQTGPIAWVMGAEGSGMRRLTREHCDYLVRIPMAGTVESLNVSVATGVCLYETVRQRMS
jgi:23S rRNA (guanosine2251-2'-O)-methyltransferase